MSLPLEQQVAPLELCRRLKELGAPNDSMFGWRMARSSRLIALAERRVVTRPAAGA